MLHLKLKKKKKKPADDSINAATNKNSTDKQKDLRENNQPKINEGEANDATINNRSIAENNTTIKPKTSSAKKKSLDDKQSVPFLSRNEKGKSKKEIAADPQIGEKSIASEVKTKEENLSDKKNVATDSQINKESVADEMKNKREDLSDKEKENKAADSLIGKTAVAKNVNSKKSKSLQLGFTGGAGFSDINKMVSNSDLPASVALGTAGYNATPSAIQIGISFYAGGFLEKSFSKKISMSAGLNYHYYSTRIRTGKTVDSIIYVPASYFNTVSTVPGALVSRSAYYTSGTSNTYINHYHFFELPVMINFQLNNNKKLPVTWQAGLSLSYLINTNALQFDPSSGTYYKDNSFYNKTQVNLLTGFTIGFYRKKNLVEIGPEVQYGATNLLHGYTNNSQHIFYGGLKLSLVPWKNN